MAIVTHTLKDGAKRYSAVFNVNGKQRWKRFRTKREAQAFQDTARTKVREGSYVEAKRLLFGEVIDRFFAHLDTRINQGDLKASSAVVIKGATNKHIRPHFHAVRCDRLQPAHVSSWVTKQSELIRDGKNIPRVYNQHLTILRSIVTWARHPAQAYLAHDPLIGVKRIPKVAKRSTPVQALTPDELLSPISAAAPPHDTVLRLLAWTGLRIGAAFALKWGDLDWERKRLSVKRGIYCGVVTTPKTGGSVRTIDVPQSLLDDLSVYREMHPPLDGDYVVRTEHGLPVDVNRWRNGAFKRAVEAAGLTGVTPHALRHTYASILIWKKLPLLYVSRQLGHATISMTADTYGHLLRESGEEAMRALTEAMVPAAREGN